MRLRGERISIRALSLEEMEALNSENFDIINENICELNITPVQREAIEIKISKMKRVDTAIHNWFTYWLIINKKTRKAMGLIGYKGINFLKEVEIGYGINEKFRGNGYVSEALSLILDWSVKQRVCRRINATGVLRENIASQRILEKNGFVKINETETDYKYVRKL